MLSRPKLSAVTVCINYDDFLAHTIGNYHKIFDELIVVTESSDLKTIELCKKTDTRYIESSSKNAKGEAFNLPALLNDGFQEIEGGDWLCKLDPDIYFPNSTLPFIHEHLVNHDELWGSNRYFCESEEDLNTFIKTGDYSGLEPPYETTDDVLGFLQIFHSSCPFLENKKRPYEQEYYVGPSRTNDRLFAQRWPVEKRKWLPFEIIHLGLEAIGKNWRGRKSGRFI